ncbi:type II secretion system protein [Mesobacillus zeae]|uniref:Type II secretion system protein n=1 Tax=Mesobacillus zeae TaxID=1917180 RepID=A0A398B835_9BACI|nr:type II secretion system protein [Mesobacillus zeae]RID83866.1 type II secretion system protein [Mesobacillus zeae]
MLSKRNGFFLAELLLSISAWLIAAAFLLPLAMFLVGEGEQLRQEGEALRIVYDELSRQKVSMNGTVYHISMLQGIDGKNGEVCVRFDGYRKKECSICRFVE